MIEAVARAICRASGQCKYVGNRCNTGRCSVSPDVARAAIAAMREPSESMQAAGRDVLATWLPRGELSRDPDHQWQPSNDIYRAMIDEALAGS